MSNFLDLFHKYAGEYIYKVEKNSTELTLVSSIQLKGRASTSIHDKNRGMFIGDWTCKPTDSHPTDSDSQYFYLEYERKHSTISHDREEGGRKGSNENEMTTSESVTLMNEQTLVCKGVFHITSIDGSVFHIEQKEGISLTLSPPTTEGDITSFELSSSSSLLMPENNRDIRGKMNDKGSMVMDITFEQPIRTCKDHKDTAPPLELCIPECVIRIEESGYIFVKNKALTQVQQKELVDGWNIFFLLSLSSTSRTETIDNDTFIYSSYTNQSYVIPLSKIIAFSSIMKKLICECVDMKEHDAESSTMKEMELNAWQIFCKQQSEECGLDLFESVGVGACVSRIEVDIACDNNDEHDTIQEKESNVTIKLRGKGRGRHALSELDHESPTKKDSNPKRNNHEERALLAYENSRKSPKFLKECIPVDLPNGWIIHTHKRTKGKHIDRYWFSPKLKQRFRSRNEVTKYMRCLDEVGEDNEKKAWEQMMIRGGIGSRTPTEGKQRNRKKINRGEIDIIDITSSPKKRTKIDNISEAKQFKRQPGSSFNKHTHINKISEAKQIKRPPEHRQEILLKHAMATAYKTLRSRRDLSSLSSLHIAEGKIMKGKPQVPQKPFTVMSSEQLQSIILKEEANLKDIPKMAESKDGS